MGESFVKDEEYDESDSNSRDKRLQRGPFLFFFFFFYDKNTLVKRGRYSSIAHTRSI